jgi:Protein of unknown function (DUF3431)
MGELLPGRSIDLVIARYNETLEWLDESPFTDHTFRRVIVYNKGITQVDPHPKITDVIDLENVGRESHTYLHHVIQNYDSLADMTIFLPGSLISDKHKKLIRIRELFDAHPNDVEHTFYNDLIATDIYQDYYDFSLDNWSASNQENYKINPEHILTPSKYQPFGEWYRHYFGEDAVYKLHALQGVFGISRKIAHQRCRSFYQEIIQDLEVSSNPEVGHYFERGWAAVFDIKTDALQCLP